MPKSQKLNISQARLILKSPSSIEGKKMPRFYYKTSSSSGQLFAATKERFIEKLLFLRLITQEDLASLYIVEVKPPYANPIPPEQ